MYVDGEGEESKWTEKQRVGRQRRPEDVGREWQEDMANSGSHHQWNVNHMPDTAADIFYQFLLLTYPIDPRGGMVILPISQMSSLRVQGGVGLGLVSYSGPLG